MKSLVPGFTSFHPRFSRNGARVTWEPQVLANKEFSAKSGETMQGENSEVIPFC